MMHSHGGVICCIELANSEALASCSLYWQPDQIGPTC